MSAGLFIRIRKAGFVGPRYRGWWGKLRLFLQETFWHTEYLFVATATTFHQAAAALNSSVTLIFIRKFGDLAPYVAELDAAYFHGYAAMMEEAFGWGQLLILAMVGGRVTGFGWVRQGTEKGSGFQFGRLFKSQYLVYRVGVLPAFRRQRINVTFYHLLLEHLFANSAGQVFVNCHCDNIPSVKAIVEAGFQPLARIRILGNLFGKKHKIIRWNWIQALPKGVF